ncbi:hypothetical protein [Natronococcus wangiae]|uniref:hypothetical protein n=1 Tax=Natronococcus wangiae TaxID=3068275 RepID=UPI00273F6031|nr:hypothetical protein [Natronococcus sp. AD5]
MKSLTDTEQTERAESDESKLLEETPLSTGDPVTIMAALSVAFSWYQFYVREDETAGIFVGLWAPTLLGASSYLQQKELYARIEDGLSFK